MFHLAEFCRICLSKTNQLISIQHEDEDKVHISEKLLFINPSLIPFDFVGDDQYPKWVCVLCKTQINDAYYLLKKALESSSVLDRLIKHVNTTNQPLNIAGDIKDFVERIPDIKEEAPHVSAIKIRSISSINASVVKIKSVPKHVQIGPEEPEQHTCTICRKTFRNQVGFTVHKNWHKKLERSVPGIEYYCEYCELPPFKTLGALRRHADGHSTYFKRQKKLKQIENEFELDDLQTGPECGQCKRTFPTLRELNSHRRTDKHEIHKLYKPKKHP